MPLFFPLMQQSQPFNPNKNPWREPGTHQKKQQTDYATSEDIFK